MHVTVAQGAQEQALYRGLPMIMTRLPEPLLSDAEVTGGFSAVSTAVGPEGPRMSLARLGLRHLLCICTCRTLRCHAERSKSPYWRACHNLHAYIGSNGLSRHNYDRRVLMTGIHVYTQGCAYPHSNLLRQA